MTQAEGKPTIRRREYLCDFDRLKRAFEVIGMEIPFMEARLDFWCCEECARESMKAQRKDMWIFASEDCVDEAFEPNLMILPPPHDVAVRTGRSPEMTGPLEIFHSFPGDAMEYKRRVVEILTGFGFIVEWNVAERASEFWIKNS